MRVSINVMGHRGSGRWAGHPLHSGQSVQHNENQIDVNLCVWLVLRPLTFVLLASRDVKTIVMHLVPPYPTISVKCLITKTKVCLITKTSKIRDVSEPLSGRNWTRIAILKSKKCSRIGPKSRLPAAIVAELTLPCHVPRRSRTDFPYQQQLPFNWTLVLSQHPT